MKFSKKGYLSDSPDKNNSENIIQGNNFPIKGTDDKGYTKIMQPGYDYIFPGAKHVVEKPLK